MSWVRSLFASNDVGADSVIVGGLSALMAMTSMNMWVVFFEKTPFSATEYAMAAGGLLAAIAGSKRLRDGTPAPADGGK